MPFIPILLVLGVGVLIARSVQKAAKRDQEFITAQFKKEIEADEAANRG
jgi:hypothetical protein